MHFSSIAVLIQAYVEGLIRNNPLKDASIFLTIPSKTPFLCEDSNKVQLRVPDAEVTAHSQSYLKIQQGTNIRLDNVSINIEFNKGGYQVNSIELSSKKVNTDVGGKEKEIKNFELKAELIKSEGTFPLTILTQRYFRRMQKQDQAKKYFKPTKLEVLSFSNYSKKSKKAELPTSSQLKTLDSESVGILRHLLPYVDKDQLFNVLIKKNLKDKQSKKLVRLAVVPTDVDSDNEGVTNKRKFNRNTVLELLAQYQAREEMMQ